MNTKIKLKKYKKETSLKDYEALSLLSYDDFLANSSFDRVQKIISELKAGNAQEIINRIKTTIDSQSTRSIWEFNDGHGQ